MQITEGDAPSAFELAARVARLVILGLHDLEKTGMTVSPNVPGVLALTVGRLGIVIPCGCFVERHLSVLNATWHPAISAIPVKATLFQPPHVVVPPAGDQPPLGLHCLPPWKKDHSIPSTYHHIGTVRNESGIPIPTMSVVSGGSSLCSVATIAAPIIGAIATSKKMIRV